MLSLQQQTALKKDIDADPALSAMPLNADGYTDIARAYNVIVGQGIHSRMVTARGVLAELGAQGAAILDKLEVIATQVSMVKWAMKFLFTDGIDVGHPNTVALLDGLVGQGALTEPEANAIKALALQDETRAERLLSPWRGAVTPDDVEKARAL